MNTDDKICYCFGVSLRKLINYARRTKPHCASQMTECLGAGTGCGWCIPYLIKIAEDPDRFSLEGMTPREYAAGRDAYRAEKRPKNTLH